MQNFLRMIFRHKLAAPLPCIVLLLCTRENSHRITYVITHTHFVLILHNIVVQVDAMSQLESKIFEIFKSCNDQKNFSFEQNQAIYIHKTYWNRSIRLRRRMKCREELKN